MKLRKLKIPCLIVVAVFCIYGLVTFINNLDSRSTIIYQQKDIVESNSLKEDKSNVATKATPIIYSNVLIGAKYGEKFIDAQTYAASNGNAQNIKISAFNDEGKLGVFEIRSFQKYTDNTIYAITNLNNVSQKYVAVAGDTEISNRYRYERKDEASIKEAEKSVKKAIFKYLLPNNTVEIKRVLDVSLEKEKIGRLIVATSKTGTSKKGVYSIVLYQEEGSKNPQILKLYYARNKENTLKNWPVYDVGFVGDLNDDTVYEVILQEVTGNKITFSVMQHKDNAFNEVLEQQLQMNSK